MVLLCNSFPEHLQYPVYPLSALPPLGKNENENKNLGENESFSPSIIMTKNIAFYV